MQKKKFFDGLKSYSVLDVMRKMLNDELCMEYGFINKGEYEWIIGSDVWVRIASDINEFKVSLLYRDREIIYKIFDIEVTISSDNAFDNTIILRRRNEMGEMECLKELGYVDYSRISYKFKINSSSVPAIENVIFNEPATIVFWSDGSKTVVKCQDGDIYDQEKGLAMAISKKALGNEGNYCNEFKKWLPEEDK